jgi:hypothetical protein
LAVVCLLTTSPAFHCVQLDSGRKQKSLLADRISELEMAAVAGEGELRRAREELEGLQVCVGGGGGVASRGRGCGERVGVCQQTGLLSYTQANVLCVLVVLP